jgi:hypothetical protein
MPNQPGNMVVNADGMNQRGAVVNGVMPAQVAAKGRGGRVVQQQMYGALVGRIGGTGRSFLVGSKFEGPVAEDGKLYLRIMPSPYGTESTGTYDVHVSSDR